MKQKYKAKLERLEKAGLEVVPKVTMPHTYTDTTVQTEGAFEEREQMRLMPGEMTIEDAFYMELAEQKSTR